MGACRKVRRKSRYCLDQISGVISEGAERFLTVKMSVIVMWEFSGTVSMVSFSIIHERMKNRN